MEKPRTIQVLTSATADSQFENYIQGKAGKAGLKNVLASFLSEEMRKKYGHIYVCTVCCKLFKKQTDLKAHITIAHINIRKCVHCLEEGKDFSFETMYEFACHINHCHPGKEKSVKSYVLVPNPDAAKAFGITFFAKLSDYSKPFLENALQLYCQTENIQLIQPPSHDSVAKDGPQPRPVPDMFHISSTKSQNVSTLNLSTSLSIIKKKSASIETSVSINNLQQPALEVNSNLDTSNLKDSDLDEERNEQYHINQDESIIDDQICEPANYNEKETTTIHNSCLANCCNQETPPVNEESDKILDEESATPMSLVDNQRKQIYFFINPKVTEDELKSKLKTLESIFHPDIEVASKSWKYTCRHLYNTAKWDDDVYKMLFVLWGIQVREVHLLSKLPVDSFILFKQLIFGVVDPFHVPYQNSLNLCQILECIPESSPFCIFLLSTMKVIVNLNLISDWIQNDEAMHCSIVRKLVLWFILKNPNVLSHPQSVFVRLPFSMLEQIKPQNLELIYQKGIFNDMTEKPKVTFSETYNCYFLDMDHGQLIIFLFHWTGHYLSTLCSEKFDKISYSIMSLKEMIDPSYFNLDRSGVCNKQICKLKIASFYYFKLFVSLWDTIDFNESYQDVFNEDEDFPIFCELNETEQPLSTAVNKCSLQNLVVDKLFSAKPFQKQVDVVDNANSHIDKIYLNTIFLQHLCPALGIVYKKTKDRFRIQMSQDSIFENFVKCCHDVTLTPKDMQSREHLLFLSTVLKVNELYKYLIRLLSTEAENWTPGIAVIMLQEGVIQQSPALVNKSLKVIEDNLDAVLASEAFYFVLGKGAMEAFLKNTNEVGFEKTISCTFNKWNVVQCWLNKYENDV